MTNHITTQIKLLKKWENCERFAWDVDEEKFLFTLDGYVAYIVPLKYLLIDIDKISKVKPKTNNLIKSIFTIKDEDYSDAWQTSIVIKHKAVILKSDNCEVWVDSKLFKEFDSAEFRYMTYNEKSAVRIYMNDKELVAILMPKRKMEND